MTETWKSYFCNVNDELASIALDLGLRPDAPMATKPWLLWVWIYMRSPRPDGLSASSEFDVLAKIEDELSKELGRACEAIQSGRITTKGHSEFYFYCKDSDDFKSTVKTVMKNFKAYKFDLGSQSDPRWDQYLNVLYPSEEDMQRILNQDVLETLMKHGDTLKSVRDVHHWIYFRRPEDRDIFAAQARELGYQIEDQHERSGEEHSCGLIITRDQSVTPGEIDEAVLELFRLAKEMDADYDGWEAQLISLKN